MAFVKPKISKILKKLRPKRRYNKYMPLIIESEISEEDSLEAASATIDSQIIEITEDKLGFIIVADD